MSSEEPPKRDSTLRMKALLPFSVFPPCSVSISKNKSKIAKSQYSQLKDGKVRNQFIKKIMSVDPTFPKIQGILTPFKSLLENQGI